MTRWTFLFAVLNAFIAVSTATPVETLEKRDKHKGLWCDSNQGCISWYNTGSAQCSSGYRATPYHPPHYTHGTYCEKTCSDSEVRDCNASQCKFYTSECNKAPANTICGDALRTCGGAIKMDKSVCKKEKVGSSVTYFKERGVCIKNPYKGPERPVTFVFVDVDHDEALDMKMTCNAITKKGEEYWVGKVKSVGGLKCKPKEYGWFCTGATRANGKMKKAQDEGYKTCELAETSYGEKAGFTTEDFHFA